MFSIRKNVWGKEVLLGIFPEGDDEDVITEEQLTALERLSSLWDVVEQAAPELEERYCKGDESSDEDSVAGCVTPRYLFLPEKQEKRTVALMCDCTFDPEHGLALVFVNEKLKEIGLQDIIL